jgi:hypothetical protein
VVSLVEELLLESVELLLDELSDELLEELLLDLPMVRLTLPLELLLAARDLASSEMLTVSPESELPELSPETLKEPLAFFDMELTVMPPVELPSFKVDARLV